MAFSKFGIRSSLVKTFYAIDGFSPEGILDDSIPVTKANKDLNANQRFMGFLPLSQAEEDDLKVLKIDLPALIKAIEEIENRVKMEQILNKNKSNKQNEIFDQVEGLAQQHRMQQFAMLNFKKNNFALKYAQNNPSDETNQVL